MFEELLGTSAQDRPPSVLCAGSSNEGAVASFGQGSIVDMLESQLQSCCGTIGADSGVVGDLLHEKKKLAKNLDSSIEQLEMMLWNVIYCEIDKDVMTAGLCGFDSIVQSSRKSLGGFVAKCHPFVSA